MGLPPVQLKENVAQMVKQLGNILPAESANLIERIAAFHASGYMAYTPPTKARVFYVNYQIPVAYGGGDGTSPAYAFKDLETAIITINNMDPGFEPSATNRIKIVGLGDATVQGVGTGNWDLPDYLDLGDDFDVAGVGTGSFDLPDFVDLDAPGWTFSTEGATYNNATEGCLNLHDNSHARIKGIILDNPNDIAIWKNSGSGFATVEMTEGITLGSGTSTDEDSTGVYVESGTLSIKMFKNEATIAYDINAGAKLYYKCDLQDFEGNGTLEGAVGDIITLKTTLTQAQVRTLNSANGGYGIELITDPGVDKMIDIIGNPVLYWNLTGGTFALAQSWIYYKSLSKALFHGSINDAVAAPNKFPELPYFNNVPVTEGGNGAGGLYPAFQGADGIYLYADAEQIAYEGDLTVVMSYRIIDLS